VPTIALDMEDWESLCRTIDEYFQAQGVCVTKQSGVGFLMFVLNHRERQAPWVPAVKNPASTTDCYLCSSRESPDACRLER